VNVDGIDLYVRFLGGFAVRVHGEWHEGPPPKRGRELIQYLGAYPRRVATCGELAEAFWPDVDADCVTHRIHLSVSGARHYLRKILHDEGGIRRTPGGYAWTSRMRVSSDVEQLLRFCESDSTEALESAVTTYAGEFLAGESVEWVQPLRVRCATAYGYAVDRLAQRAIADGNYARALSYALQLADADPGHEGAVRLAMRCFAALGQRGRAIERYNALRVHLARNLGIKPSEETVTLARELRTTEVVELFESVGRAALV
jgi:DNA-binding SARP family transcriptional activator